MDALLVSSLAATHGDDVLNAPFINTRRWESLSGVTADR